MLGIVAPLMPQHSR